MTTAKELALAHWEWYVQPTIEVHMPEDEKVGIAYTREAVIDMCRHHYLTAWEHGAKHEREAQKEAARGAFLNGAVHGGEHPFDLVAKGELPPAFGPMIPDGVTEAGAVQQGTGEGAATCTHFDGTICLAYPGAGANFDCYHCGDYFAKAELADLAPIFDLIAEEHARSLGEHEPWEEAVHSPDTMLAVIKAELAEVELALSMGDHAETVKELVHVANVAVKTISELTRRGHL